jgi:hypothetical protein
MGMTAFHLFIGQLKNPKDRDLAALLGLSREKKDVEPMLLETIPLPAAVPGDEAVGMWRFVSGFVRKSLDSRREARYTLGN